MTLQCLSSTNVHVLPKFRCQNIFYVHHDTHQKLYHLKANFVQLQSQTLDVFLRFKASVVLQSFFRSFVHTLCTSVTCQNICWASFIQPKLAWGSHFSLLACLRQATMIQDDSNPQSGSHTVTGTWTEGRFLTMEKLNHKLKPN